MRQMLGVLALALTLSLLQACDEGPTESELPPVLSLDVAPDEVRVAVGSDALLEAEVNLGSANDSSVTWASLADSVARVDSTGLVTGVSEGETAVIASAVADPSVQDTALVMVERIW